MHLLAKRIKNMILDCSNLMTESSTGFRFVDYLTDPFILNRHSYLHKHQPVLKIFDEKTWSASVEMVKGSAKSLTGSMIMPLIMTWVTRTMTMMLLGQFCLVTNGLILDAVVQAALQPIRVMCWINEKYGCMKSSRHCKAIFWFGTHLKEDLPHPCFLDLMDGCCISNIRFYCQSSKKENKRNKLLAFFLYQFQAMRGREINTSYMYVIRFPVQLISTIMKNVLLLWILYILTIWPNLRSYLCIRSKLYMLPSYWISS